MRRDPVERDGGGRHAAALDGSSARCARQVVCIAPVASTGPVGWPLGEPASLGRATMTNLVGGDVEQWAALLAEPGAHLHLYGKARARDMLEQQGLGASQKKKMKNLSKGMAQKVQLIASVVHRPEFVILDEPFSGLDPMNQQGLEEMIRGLAANGATVYRTTFSGMSRDRAVAFCNALKAAGRDCIVR